MRFVRVSLPWIVLVALSSCQGSKRFYPVRGQVFIDGKPAEWVVVTFHPVNEAEADGLKPSGAVQADGSFVIRSFVVDTRTLKEGAPAGEYRVSCQWFHPDGSKSEVGGDWLPDKLQGKYADPNTSGLRVVVAEEPNEVPRFDLKK